MPIIIIQPHPLSEEYDMNFFRCWFLSSFFPFHSTILNIFNRQPLPSKCIHLNDIYNELFTSKFGNYLCMYLKYYRCNLIKIVTCASACVCVHWKQSYNRVNWISNSMIASQSNTHCVQTEVRRGGKKVEIVLMIAIKWNFFLNSKLKIPFWQQYMFIVISNLSNEQWINCPQIFFIISYYTLKHEQKGKTTIITQKCRKQGKRSERREREKKRPKK